MIEWCAAVRSLRRSRAYALGVIAIVSTAVVFLTAVFAAVDGVLFKPLPFGDTAHLYLLFGSYDGQEISPSPNDVAMWRPVLQEAELAGYHYASPLALSSSPTAPDGLFSCARVDRRFLSVLGVVPLHGGIDPRPDGGSSGVAAIALGYSAWHQLGQPAVGTLIYSKDTSFEVAAVLRDDFLLPSRAKAPETLVFVADSEWRANVSRRGGVVVRLREGAPPGTIVARLSALLQSGGDPAARFSAIRPFETVILRPVSDYMRAPARRLSTLVFAVAALLFVLACVNLATLTAARATDRVREIAIRRALGASPFQSFGVATGELLLLVGVSGTLGLWAVFGVMPLVYSAVPDAVSQLKAARADFRVGLVAMALLAAVALGVHGAGLIALHRYDFARVITRTSGSALDRRRWREVMVGVQSLMTTIIVVLGALFVVSAGKA